jgi:hypothetical protein
VWQAAVAQPLDRSKELAAPGPVDDSVGEFWIGNPWQFHGAKKNLSAYERNRVFINHQGEQFFDASFLTQADSDGDGRAVAAADLNNDGMPDLIVRQVGGGSVLLYENQFTPRSWLKVSLHGTRSNSLGIGARVTAEFAGRHVTRELYPANTFLSQMPSLVHFGLDDASIVDRLTILWPSGTEQVMERVAANQHIEVTEGNNETRRMVAR